MLQFATMPMGKKYSSLRTKKKCGLLNAFLNTGNAVGEDARISRKRNEILSL